MTRGERAYQDYFEQRKGVNSEGNPLPGWEQLSADMRAWWEQAGVKPPGQKPWWKRLGFWVNAAVLGLAAAEANVRSLEGVLPGSIFAYVAFLLPLANAGVKAWQALSAAQSAQAS